MPDPAGEFDAAARGGPVIVVGDVVTDIIVRAEGPPVRGSDRRAGITSLPGGSGANQAAWLAHFGRRVVLAGRVGVQDAAAHTAGLARHGVEPWLAADAGRASGMLVTLVDTDGERSFLTDRGANENLQRGDLPDALLGGAAHLHISGYALMAPGPRQAVLDFAALARRGGIPVSVDPGSAAFLQEVGGTRFLDWTRGFAIGFPNEDEARVLTGTAEPQAQLGILQAVYGLAVLKRGAAGAMAARGQQRWQAPARPAVSIDSTGAGDAFLAAFLAARLAGAPVQHCLEAGRDAGARACTILGGRPPPPAPVPGSGRS